MVRKPAPVIGVNQLPTETERIPIAGSSYCMNRRDAKR